MTEEQQAAYVIAMSVCCMVKAMSFNAANEYRARRGEAQAYPEEAFAKLIEEYGIHHNAVLNTFHP